MALWREEMTVFMDKLRGVVIAEEKSATEPRQVIEVE